MKKKLTKKKILTVGLSSVLLLSGMSSNITALAETTNNDVSVKSSEQADITNFSTKSIGDKYTSPKYESEVESRLSKDSAKELGNNVRKKMKEITNAELGYFKGNTIDIDLGEDFNLYNANKTGVVTYKSFTQIFPPYPGLQLSIGAGYTSGKVSIPIGTEGYSSDKTIKYKVISNKKIRIERVENRLVTDSAKLPMDVSLNSDIPFYYESGIHASNGVGVEYPKQDYFKNVNTTSYGHKLNSNIRLSYDRLEENWQWAKGDINFLDYISLEKSPEISISAKQKKFEMPAVVPNSPEEFLNVYNRMSGGTLTYTWVDQLNINENKDQTVRVKVVDQLGEYNHEATTTLNFKANQDKASLEVKNTAFNQGQTYSPKDNFVSATDVNGNDLKWDASIFKITGDKVDTNTPGIYNQTMTYNYDLNGEAKSISRDYTVTVKPFNPWPNGDTNGWNMFSGEEIELLNDPENSIIDTNEVFYADKQASIYKIFSGKEALKVGKTYKVTVYFKPLTEEVNLSSYRVKVSLKENPSSTEYRELINTTLNKGTAYQKGYYSVMNTFSVGEKESEPLINVENFQGGYIGSVSILEVQ